MRINYVKLLWECGVGGADVGKRSVVKQPWGSGAKELWAWGLRTKEVWSAERSGCERGRAWRWGPCGEGRVRGDPWVTGCITYIWE